MRMKSCFVGALVLVSLLVTLSIKGVLCYGSMNKENNDSRDDDGSVSSCGHYIAGFVYDAESKKDLKGVKVTIKGKKGYSERYKSEENGYFGFFDGCEDWKDMAGIYNLSFKKAGYKTYKKKIKWDGETYSDSQADIELNIPMEKR